MAKDKSQGLLFVQEIGRLGLELETTGQYTFTFDESKKIAITMLDFQLNLFSISSSERNQVLQLKRSVQELKKDITFTPSNLPQEVQKDMLVQALQWRETPHEYVESNINLFCDKCGLSNGHKIHL